jgi:hypothetical protein
MSKKERATNAIPANYHFSTLKKQTVKPRKTNAVLQAETKKKTVGCDEIDRSKKTGKCLTSCAKHLIRNDNGRCINPIGKPKKAPTKTNTVLQAETKKKTVGCDEINRSKKTGKCLTPCAPHLIRNDNGRCIKSSVLKEKPKKASVNKKTPVKQTNQNLQKELAKLLAEPYFGEEEENNMHSPMMMQSPMMQSPKNEDGIIYGKIITEEDENYEGELKNGKPHGNGMLTTAEGGVYKGEFKNGKPNGHGSLTDEEGYLHYDGDWKDGEPTGYVVGYSPIKSPSPINKTHVYNPLRKTQFTNRTPPKAPIRTPPKMKDPIYENRKIMEDKPLLNFYEGLEEHEKQMIRNTKEDGRRTAEERQYVYLNDAYKISIKRKKQQADDAMLQNASPEMKINYGSHKQPTPTRRRTRHSI